MDNLKRYQICYDLITYFATLISKKSQLGLIFRTKGSKYSTTLLWKDDDIFEISS